MAEVQARREAARGIERDGSTSAGAAGRAAVPHSRALPVRPSGEEEGRSGSCDGF